MEINLADYFEKLAQLSFDGINDKIVCEYTNEFIAYDKLKKIRKTPKEPSSPDMLYINDEKREVWFVEFKSSKQETIDKFKIKRKILDGLIIFYEIFENYYKYDKYYFVVYDKSASFEDQVIDEISQKDVEFDLEELEGKFLKRAFTDNCEQFIRVWDKRFNIKLT